jgi:hypothetical protein
MTHVVREHQYHGRTVKIIRTDGRHGITFRCEIRTPGKADYVVTGFDNASGAYRYAQRHIQRQEA